MAGGPYTREAWNGIIDRVNELCENPPEDTDCEPIEPLEHVDPEHIWTTGDIDEVRQKLMEICKDNVFEEELDLWKQKTIDEIEDAISQGWCDCEEDLCYGEREETILYEGTNTYEYGVYVHTCGAPSSCPDPPEVPHFDYYSIGTAVTGYSPGMGGWVRIRQIYNPPGSGRDIINDCYFNYFNCDGSQRTPLPAPRYDSEGNLRYSVMATHTVYCLACTVYVGDSFVGYCSCQKCWIGMVRCCSSIPPAPPWPCWTPPPCPCTLDEAFVRSYYGNPSDGEGGTYTYVQTKQPLTVSGLPCRTCCSDGIGWCDQFDCPDDPICEFEEEEEEV